MLSVVPLCLASALAQVSGPSESNRKNLQDSIQLPRKLPGAWVLGGFGEVQVLPPAEITITLPGGVPLEMVLIPPGSFEMGSDEPGWSDSDETPVHTVNIGYCFYMGKYEVTQAQWRAVMGDNPSYFRGDDRPVERVSWDNCQDFIFALNQLGQGTFRLPSETEWEYACRAGTRTRFYFGDSLCSRLTCDPCQLNGYAWWCGNSSSETKPVGGKLHNSYGLYDMHGNVGEWCQDSYQGTYYGAPVDGSAWELYPFYRRVVRGGGWFNYPWFCRSAHRSGYEFYFRGINLGFRLVRTP